MFSTKTSISPVFQAFLDEAVAKGVAPGFQCVVFDRESLLFNGVSGLASVPSENTPEGKPFKHETLVWMASCTKICLSLVALHIIERGLTRSGFTLKDLDSHEALVEVLPEFRHGSGSLVTQILEGFEDKLGTDGKKVMKLKEAKGKVTLRMLLTHTAGMVYDWNHLVLSELYRPSDGSVPNSGAPISTGEIRDLEVPLVAEPGKTYTYGSAADWVGEFIGRSSTRTPRQLFKEILFEPLGIPSTEADLWLSPGLLETRADIHIRDTNKGFTPIPLPTYMEENGPSEGKESFPTAGMYASLQAYSKILQAVLNQDTRILSAEVWQMAIKDDLSTRGIKIPKPEWMSSFPLVTFDVDEYAKSTTENGVGMNLLQCKVATAPTVSGRSTGSIAWAGLANSHYFIDPAKGFGAIFGTQLLPFFDPQIVDTRDEFERLVYRTLDHN